MGIPKRFALAVSGAAFAGAVALTAGAAPAGAAVSAPAGAPATGTPQHLVDQIFTGGCGGGCSDDWNDCDWC